MTGNKNHAAVALLQELQRTNANKKLNITTANPLLAGIALTQDYILTNFKLSCKIKNLNQLSNSSFLNFITTEVTNFKP